MQNFLDTKSFTVLQKSLDALWTKQKVISSNIANLDTPGYKSRSVIFEDVLNNALSIKDDSGFQKRIDSISPKIVRNDSTSMREDGNNVDIDEQSIELTRLMIQYEYMSKAFSSDISRLKYAINEGRA
jgi:flagellar basal-body rod protein FlgB